MQGMLTEQTRIFPLALQALKAFLRLLLYAVRQSLTKVITIPYMQK